MILFSGAGVGLIEHVTGHISEQAIGAAIEVHRQLGPGLLESSYHACLCRELELREILYCSEVVLPLEYKGLRIANIKLCTGVCTNMKKQHGRSRLFCRETIVKQPRFYYQVFSRWSFANVKHGQGLILFDNLAGCGF